MKRGGLTSSNRSFRRFRLFAPGSALSERLLATLLAVGFVFGAVVGQTLTFARFAIGLAGGLLLFQIVVSGRFTAVRITIIWLVFLGFVRRFLIPISGWNENDPLLLVGPACAFLLWMIGKNDRPKRDGLTLLAMMLMFLAFAHLANPHQDLVTGAKGLIFWIPPVMWFFVGRTLPLSVHEKVSRLVIVLSIPVLLEGFYHSSGRFLPFEYSWVGIGAEGFGPAIFFPGFRIRPFSVLPSPQEYGAYLAVAIVFLWGTILAGHSRKGWRLVLFAMLFTGLFLQGTRSTLALTFFAVMLMGLLWSRNMALRMALITLIVAVVGVVKFQMLPSEVGDGPVATAIEHQINGFQNPEESSVPIHREALQNGWKIMWENPLGLGLARTTRAGLLSGEWQGRTELDLPDVAISFGVMVAIFYIMFVVMVFYVAARRFGFHRSAYTVSALGIPIVLLGNIWIGGLYCVSTIVWLTFGGLTRPFEEVQCQESSAEEQAARDPSMEIAA